MRRWFLTTLASIACAASSLSATTPETDGNDSTAVEQLKEVVVRNRAGRVKKINRADNSELITQSELRLAACCNLGESFTTNPSVDVDYADAATGAEQIKLLGLSGTYVQMLTENIPNLRGAASLYGLGYIPGPWMQSIQVSKGASSVKNGYESLTGQINVELKKPQADQSVAVEAFSNHEGMAQIDAAANLHLSPRWSAGLLAHGEHSFTGHDNNGDGFLDMPRVTQLNAMNRWAYISDSYLFQAGVKFLTETRRGGQRGDHSHGGGGTNADNANSSDTHAIPYLIDIDTKRVEAFAKNAYIFDPDNSGNVALITSAIWHEQDAAYGMREYDVIQRTLYASLMFERNWGDYHALSAGLSFNYDHYRQHFRLDRLGTMPTESANEPEAVSGAYAQYTLDIDSRYLLMLGLRYDYSSLWGSMVTPRMHFRWNPDGRWSLHVSAGRGYRTPHVLAENSYVMASSREIIIDPDIRQEDGWNFGGGISSSLPLWGRTLSLSAEYYHTRFRHQLVADFSASPHQVHFSNLKGRSYSNTLQLEATYPIIEELKATIAYRLTDVKVDYGRGLEEKPLTGRWKGLFTAAWSPMMGLWQFSATLALNGGGRMPTPYTLADGTPSWSDKFGTFPTLNAQITRNFRHWAIYAGGENLTGYKQKNPIVAAAAPWSDEFDATMVYGPVTGARFYIGIRYNFTKY